LYAGIDTEKVLKQWFVKLPKESVRSQELMSELEKLLERYGKKVRSNAVIHVVTCSHHLR
jgi:hypothetical protein